VVTARDAELASIIMAAPRKRVAPAGSTGGEWRRTRVESRRAHRLHVALRHSTKWARLSPYHDSKPRLSRTYPRRSPMATQ
jgi:hypothetical protein